jgi:3-dehydroquinate dehydratase-1
MPDRPEPTLTVRDVVLGTGTPAVVVPVLAQDPGVCAGKVRDAREAGADLIEWRCDPLLAADGTRSVRAVAPEVREAAGGCPLLVTLRTADEGGLWDGAGSQLLDAYQMLLDTGICDLLDVQMFSEPDVAAQTMGAAHEAEVAVVGSHHRFDATPSEEEMVSVLTRIGDAGADVAKLAVMPRVPQDVLALLQATVRAHAVLSCPLVTMSMGALGGISRLAGAVTGSAATFAALDEGSAPGQLPLATVRSALRALELQAY